MTQYNVKTKYTYERLWQSDYSYSDRTQTSHNVIEGRYIKKIGASLGACTLEGDGQLSFELSDEQIRALADASGICVRVLAQGDGICRVTFFDCENNGYMSVASFGLGENSICFSTFGMNIKPQRMLVETKTISKADVCVSTCFVLNPLGEWGGQAEFYGCKNGSVKNEGEKLRLACMADFELYPPSFPTLPIPCAICLCRFVIPCLWS